MPCLTWLARSFWPLVVDGSRAAVGRRIRVDADGAHQALEGRRVPLLVLREGREAGRQAHRRAGRVDLRQVRRALRRDHQPGARRQAVGPSLGRLRGRAPRLPIRPVSMMSSTSSTMRGTSPPGVGSTSVRMSGWGTRGGRSSQGGRWRLPSSRGSSIPPTLRGAPLGGSGLNPPSGS